MEDPVKYGSETVVTHQGDVTIKEKTEKHNGGDTRHLEIREESIRIEDKKNIVEKILEVYGQHARGEIVGWSVDASIYEPRTLKTKRIIVTTIKLTKKPDAAAAA